MRVLGIVMVAAFLGGCASHTGRVAQGPIPESAGAAEGPAHPPAESGMEQRVGLCVVREREIVVIEGAVDPETGDSLLAGRPWREVHSEQRSPYAAANPWYISGRGLLPPGRRYPMDKYGLPRVLSPGDLRYWGEYEGIPVFVEAGPIGAVPDVAYVPVRPGCEFHPYLQVTSYGAVRG